jgi:preprotein translocase subunit SecG
MHIAVTIVHVLTCALLIGVVLLQQGKGADMGAVFGGSSSTIFGSGGAGNFLTRLTTGLAVVFMVTSLVLTYSSAQRVGSTVFDSAPLSEPPPAQAPMGGAGQPIGVEPQAAQPQEGAPAAAAPGRPTAGRCACRGGPSR